MSKKNPGVFSFLTGLAMGAAAVFFSKEENRKNTQKAVDKTIKQATALKKEIEENPELVKQKACAKAKAVSKSLSKKIVSVSSSSAKSKKK
ncbi:MAG TPA: hypothetical protein PLM16_00520 [Candidatus Woesebacteria bacterium]|nr:hypothetical protein [Candidatus Woesebacteria bacterium]